MLPPEFRVEDLFPAASREDWTRLAAEALGTDDPLARLRRAGIEGIYGECGATARIGAELPDAVWKVVQEHSAADGTGWPGLVAEAREGGVDGHLLRVDCDADSLTIDWAAIVAAAGSDAWIDVQLDAASATSVDARLGVVSPEARGCLGLDPMSWSARNGEHLDGLSYAMDDAVAHARWCTKNAPALRAFAVDGSVYHGQGCEDDLDVAIALATGLEYLRAMEAGGVSLAEGASQILFRAQVDSHFFSAMAKGRALRQLWSQLLRASGVESPSCRIFVRQGERGLSALDPWVNVLRSTAAVFGGALGGADFVGALRYDQRLAEKDPAAQRLARNTALILREESHLGRVKDPCGGAYALESMTEALSKRAFELLRGIEGAGGVSAFLASGSLMERISASRREWQDRLRTRKEARTGVSEYAQAAETIGASTVESESWHFDEDFEELRLLTDIFRARTGRRPSVVVATLGRPAEFSARQSWLTNLLAAGGIEAEVLDPVETPAELDGNPADGQLPVVLCTSDARLASSGLEALRALSKLGYSKLWVAGRPPQDQAEWTRAGARGWVHVGIDVINWLGEVQAGLGVEA
jgi:methylmalonyl-CoA mutase